MRRASMMLSAARVLAVSAAFFGVQAYAGTLAAGPYPQLAQAQAADSEAVFTRLDANRDGVIDREEAGRLPGLMSVFGQADANSDGKLDKPELQSALQLIK